MRRISSSVVFLSMTCSQATCRIPHAITIANGSSRLETPRLSALHYCKLLSMWSLHGTAHQQTSEKKVKTHAIAQRNNMAAVDVALQRSATVSDNGHACGNTTVTACLVDATHACPLPRLLGNIVTIARELVHSQCKRMTTHNLDWVNISVLY